MVRQHRFKSCAPVVGPCSAEYDAATAQPAGGDLLQWSTFHTTPHTSRVKTAEAVLSRAQFVVDGINRERVEQQVLVIGSPRAMAIWMDLNHGMDAINLNIR